MINMLIVAKKKNPIFSIALKLVSTINSRIEKGLVQFLEHLEFSVTRTAVSVDF